MASAWRSATTSSAPTHGASGWRSSTAVAAARFPHQAVRVHGSFTSFTLGCQEPCNRVLADRRAWLTSTAYSSFAKSQHLRKTLCCQAAVATAPLLEQGSVSGGQRAPSFDLVRSGLLACLPPAPPQIPPPQQQPSFEKQPQQFESVIHALRLALKALQPAPPRADGRSPSTRAVQLACMMADLVAAGLPLDAAAMSACVVAEAAAGGYLSHATIAQQLGTAVAALVHDMLLVREAPSRIELLDDNAASAIREWCLSFHDVRACAVEVVGWWDELQHSAGLPDYAQQTLALEVLQIGAPLGHALGLGSVAALMEDLCLKALFPSSYASAAAWLRSVADPAEDALFEAQRGLLAALDAHPTFGRLCGGVVVKARTKSLFSVMKKLLQLGDMARGGRSRAEIFDLLGMRAVVQPLAHLPPAEAEAAAMRACYVVQDVASQLWRPLSERTKDYIACPKSNGYQSIHTTLQLPGLISMDASEEDEPASSASDADGGAGGGPLCMELQIRTVAMDRAAESGNASHAVYKGGLDARSAAQLAAWTRELTQRMAAQPRGRLLLRAAAASLPPCARSRPKVAPQQPSEAPVATPSPPLALPVPAAQHLLAPRLAVPSLPAPASSSSPPAPPLVASLSTSSSSMSFSSMSLCSMDMDGLDVADLTIGLAPMDAARAAEQLFRRLDRNGDGKISLGEVRQMLSDVAAAPGTADPTQGRRAPSELLASESDAEVLLELLCADMSFSVDDSRSDGGGGGRAAPEVSLQQWVDLQQGGGVRRSCYAA